MEFIRSLGEVALGSRFKIISDTLYNSVDYVYKQIGVDFQSRWFMVLHILKKHPFIGITEIAKLIHQSHPSVSQTSQVLLKRGLIESVKDKKDERKRLLGLSKKGLDLYEKLSPTFDAIDKSMTQIILDANIDLMRTISSLEDQLEKTPFHEVILNRLKLQSGSQIEIIEHTSGCGDYFKTLNIEWLKKYFYVEAFDNEVLSNPEKYILEPGGFIYYAKYGDEFVGTCALMKDKNDMWELTKMAVTEKYQGMKIGQKLAETVIKKFHTFKKGTLFLETNSKLTPAIKLYEKLGFVHQKSTKEGSHYSRANVYMIYTPEKIVQGCN